MLSIERCREILGVKAGEEGGSDEFIRSLLSETYSLAGLLVERASTVLSDPNSWRQMSRDRECRVSQKAELHAQ
jgi:hypothetical protein